MSYPMARNPDTQIVADFEDARWTLRVDELIPRLRVCPESDL
jgi:hypothetical protein